MSENIEKIFVEEEFSNFSPEIQGEIKDWLNFDKDKWSYRLIILQYYFLGEKANEFDKISDIVDRAYGSKEQLGLIRIFKMDKWGIFPAKKAAQLDTQDIFENGRKNARNRPRDIANQGILMQSSGKNINLTPLGIAVAQFLYFKFLRENNIDLTILTKLASHLKLDSELIESILNYNITTNDALNMSLVEQIEETTGNFKPSRLVTGLIEFLLQHPYIDVTSSNELSSHFRGLVERHILSQLQADSSRKLLIEQPDIPEVLDLSQINWIYELELKKYNQQSILKKWLMDAPQAEDGNYRGFQSPILILESGPGTGKSVWMLQNAIKVYLSNRENIKEGNERYTIPLLVKLGDFSLEKSNDIAFLSYQNRPLLKLHQINEVNVEKYSTCFLQILNLLSEKSNSLFWISTYLKLIPKPRVLLFLDGWDELEEVLKPFFKGLLKYIMKQNKIPTKILIATRYFDPLLESIKRNVALENNLEEKNIAEDIVLTLDFPTRDQVKSYLKAVGLNVLLQKNEMKEIKRRFGKEITPLDMWLLGLFPNFQELPINRADLYERWVKYEVIIELQEKMHFSSNQITTKLQLDDILANATSIQRKRDKQFFTLAELLDGPVPSVTPKEDKNDYAILKFLPKLIYNRFKNPNYFFSFDIIVQSNPLFKRFIHTDLTKELRRNFKLINPHYEYFFVAFHAFNTYLRKLTFDLLQTPQVEQFFKEILINHKERRDSDQQYQIPDNFIILRNNLESIAPFNDEKIGYPINQAGPFLFKISIKDFINVFRDQVYQFCWQRFASSANYIPRQDYLTRFEGVTKSIDRNINETQTLLRNVLYFQNKFNDEDWTLSKIFDQIEIETPFLIPVIIYAFNLSETEDLTAPQLRRLEESPYIDLPWIKLWIYREIIRQEPERIEELTKFALIHTHNYLIKFCAVNIIPPLILDIKDSLFDLSISLFNRLKKRKYRQILIFHWSSHCLSPQQLDSIEKLQQNYNIEKEIRFDLTNLLILHNRKPDSNLYGDECNLISPTRVFHFLINAFNSKLFSNEDFSTWIRNLSVQQVTFIQKSLSQDENDAEDYMRDSLRPPSDFTNFISPILMKWWAQNTSYKRTDISTLFELVEQHFSLEKNSSEKEGFKEDLFQLAQYFRNYENLPEDDLNFIFDQGVLFLEKLLKNRVLKERIEKWASPEIFDYFSLFSNFITKNFTLSKNFEFYEKFKNYFSFSKFFVKCCKQFPDSVELFQKIQEIIASNPSIYIPREDYDRRGKISLPTLQDLLNGDNDAALLFSLPENEILKILNENFDESQNDDLFNLIYNLTLIGTPAAYQKIAALWETNYVKVDTPCEEDPSFYIWRAIGPALHETIYQYLSKPLAKIFFLTCLSVYDSSRTHKLNEKYCNLTKNSYIITKFQEFSQDDLRNALKLFIRADWEIRDYTFLFNWVKVDAEIIDLIFEKVRSGKIKLSSFQENAYHYPRSIPKNLRSEEPALFTLLFLQAPERFEEIIQETLDFCDKEEKLALFQTLHKINHPIAIALVEKLGEIYPKFIPSNKDLGLNDIRLRIQATNNFVYISKILEEFNWKIDFNHLNSAQLTADINIMAEIEMLILQKWNDGVLTYYNTKTDSNAIQTLKTLRQKIWETRKSRNIQNCTLVHFIELLRHLNPKKQLSALHDRYPFYNNRTVDIPTISSKLRELRELSGSFQQDRGIIDTITRRIDDYEIVKEHILRDKIQLPSNNEVENIPDEPDSNEFEHLADNVEGNTLKDLESSDRENIDNDPQKERDDNLGVGEVVELAILKQIQTVPMDISTLLNDFEKLDDCYELRSILDYVRDSFPFDEEFLRDDLKPHSNQALNANRKIVRKYLFYIILRQREIHQTHLSHDSQLVFSDEDGISNEAEEVDEGISVDNLFGEILADSIKSGYYFDALNTLKEKGRDDWYQFVKSYVMLQINPNAKKVNRGAYGCRHSTDDFPLSENIIHSLQQNEQEWVHYFHFSRIYFNLFKTQLISVAQFFNHFKFSSEY